MFVAEDTIKVSVPVADYVRHVRDGTTTFVVQSVASVDGGADVHYALDRFAMLVPELDLAVCDAQVVTNLQLNERLRCGSEATIDVTVTNPLPIVLRHCSIVVDGAGLVDCPMTLPCP